MCREFEARLARRRRSKKVTGWRSVLCGILAAVAMIGVAHGAGEKKGRGPIGLLPENTHYLQWRGRPTILITSGEHYGAVLNRAFDYGKYLKKLESLGLNLTRTFSGAYCEKPGAFGIQHNTLAPERGDLICPWARSETPGYANGGNKFDLEKWDLAYFERLRDFVGQASRRGVVVELVLFCPFYEDSMWEYSPMNAANNVNGVGKCKREEAYTLKHASLQAVQDRMVRKIVAEMKEFDNLYYEICNEPYFGGVTLEWQAHIAGVIAEAERDFEHRHLIAQNIANDHAIIKDPNPLVSIFNFHYARPEAASDNYGLNRVLGDDETGFRGSEAGPYRIEGWNFILAGGGIYDNLDYTFTVGHEDGTAENKAPGSAGTDLHGHLGILRDFIKGFEFWKMRPDSPAVREVSPKEEVKVQVLAEKGRAYAVYLSGGEQAQLVMRIPEGSYKAEWVDTKTGEVTQSERITHRGGDLRLKSPKYKEDVALRILREQQEGAGLVMLSDFESGDLGGWSISGNAPEICSSPTRAGRYAMKTSLDRHKDKVAYRTEVSGPKTDVGKEYWYGFSIFLPDDYAADKIWEIVAQWHGVPDFSIGEDWRNPVMALSTDGGKWGFVSRWDAKRNTFEGGRRRYGGTRNYDLGPYGTGVWTDWVVRVRWSYQDDGILDVWKDGEKVISQEGPTAFNDAEGPYFKMGLYKGWKEPDRPSDAVSNRLLYQDEFRMAVGEDRYDDVVPGRSR